MFLECVIPNEFQDEGFIKMNNFCLRRDEKAKDSLVTLQLFWQWIRQKETFLSLILMFFWYKYYSFKTLHKNNLTQSYEHSHRRPPFEAQYSKTIVLPRIFKK